MQNGKSKRKAENGKEYFPFLQDKWKMENRKRFPFWFFSSTLKKKMEKKYIKAKRSVCRFSFFYFMFARNRKSQDVLHFSLFPKSSVFISFSVFSFFTEMETVIFFCFVLHFSEKRKLENVCRFWFPLWFQEKKNEKGKHERQNVFLLWFSFFFFHFSVIGNQNGNR